MTSEYWNRCSGITRTNVLRYRTAAHIVYNCSLFFSFHILNSWKDMNIDWKLSWNKKTLFFYEKWNHKVEERKVWKQEKKVKHKLLAKVNWRCCKFNNYLNPRICLTIVKERICFLRCWTPLDIWLTKLRAVLPSSKNPFSLRPLDPEAEKRRPNWTFNCYSFQIKEHHLSRNSKMKQQFASPPRQAQTANIRTEFTSAFQNSFRFNLSFQKIVIRNFNGTQTKCTTKKITFF